MNMATARDKLYDMAEMFFQGATVIWTEQKATRPQVPYVTLKCGAVNRTSFPVEDGDGARSYQAQTILEVNIYTKGRPIRAGKGVTNNYENTATSDLMEFADFLESEEIVDRLAEAGLNVSLMPPVRDLTDLQNDSSYRYRAMAEFSVAFGMEAGGKYGLGGSPLMPNSSGGGSKLMANEDTEAIESVEITEGGTDDEE